MNLPFHKQPEIRRQSFIFIVLTTAGASSLSLLGGIGIEAVQGKLLAIVPLVIALPAMNTMVGNYAAIMGAHAGDPTERSKTKRELASAIAKSVSVNIIGIIGLSLLIAQYRDYELTSGFVIKFVPFIIGAILTVVIAMFTITTILDRLLEQHRLNPDDVLIPVVTTISDIFMLGLIALSVVLIF